MVEKLTLELLWNDSSKLFNDRNFVIKVPRCLSGVFEFLKENVLDLYNPLSSLSLLLDLLQQLGDLLDLLLLKHLLHELHQTFALVGFLNQVCR